MAKRVLITMADELYFALAQKRKKQAYLTIQELVNEILRRNLLIPKTFSRTNKGRPEKKTFEDYFSTPTAETRKLQRQGLI